MKNKLTSILILLLFTSLISAVEINYSVDYNSNGLQLTAIKYEPYPANPGEYFELWLQVRLGATVNYAKFQLVEEFPFSLDSNENPLREFKEINSQEILLKYTVRVSKDAVEGVNILKIKSSTTLNGNEVERQFDINIANAQTNFDAVIQESSDSAISLAIANVGKNTANSVIVKVPEQESFTVSGTDGQMVGNLDAGDYTVVSFSVNQNKIKSSNSIFKFDIYYTDNIGERRIINMELPIKTKITTGNFSSENFSLKNENSSNSSIYLGLAIVLIGGVLVFVYKKYLHLLKNLKEKTISKIDKKVQEKEELPNWIKTLQEKERKK